MTCGECKHYEPSRSLSTNRPLRSQPGFCLYVVVWPKMPKALWRFVLPHRERVEKDDNRECACFMAKSG